MVDGNASMYLGSPRMAEMVIGEKVTLEEMGGAKMHCSESRLRRRARARREEEAIAFAKRYFAMMPQNASDTPPLAPRAGRRSTAGKPLEDVIPADENKSFDMIAVIDAIIDEGSFVEIKKLFAKEIITGFARIDGRAVGIVANQPKYKGGVLFVDSADKAARFIWLCDAFNVPLLYLADVPGLHDRHEGREAGDHPRGREDDRRGERGDGAEDLRHRAQGVRRGALRDVRARRSSRTRASRCRPRRSP